MKFLSVAAAVLAVPAVLAVGPYAQCGGQYYTSTDTTCVSGYSCVVVSTLYSQCKPAAAATSPSPAPIPSPSPSPRPAGKGIDGRIKAKGKLYWGAILDPNTINNSAVTTIIKNEFGALTCENSMKMDALQPNQGSFNWGNADAVVNFAQQNGLLMRGHTLVWHSQLPGWVSSINNRNTLTTVIQNHANAVLGRWKGKIYAWDVVNECLNEDGSMRPSVYSNVMQEDFIGVAFKAARAADPSTKLYINDYNLDSASYAKTIGMADKVKKWKAAGAPIDAIGSQGHLQAGQGPAAQAALAKLATVVDEVAITELDIVNAGTNDYAAVAKACLAVPQCIGITSWGVRDSESWRASSNPLMFDRSGNKKPAYTAAYDALA